MFALDFSQSSQNFGCFIRCRYSISSPVAPSNTAAASVQKNAKGNLRLEACFAFRLRPAISSADVNLCCLAALVFWEGDASS